MQIHKNQPFGLSQQLEVQLEVAVLMLSICIWDKYENKAKYPDKREFSNNVKDSSEV